MAQSELLNMPDFVYQLLVKQSMDKDCELIWTVGGHGKQVELVMKWLPRGSKWEEPFADKEETTVRRKSKACRRRDANRRKWFNVNRNSKEVGTSDCESEIRPENHRETVNVGMSTPERASTMDISCEAGVVDPDPAVVTHDQTGVCEVEQPAVVMLDQTSDTPTQDSQQSQDSIDSQDSEDNCEVNKENFHLFVRAIKDDDTNSIYALTKEGWIYKCDMNDT